MRRWLARVGLRVRFAIALAALVLIVAGVFGGVVGEHSIDQTRERIGQSLVTDAQRVADRLNADVAQRSRDLVLFTVLDPFRSVRDAAVLQSTLESIRRAEPSYAWLAAADTTGNVIAATDPAIVGTELQAQLDFRDPFRSRAVALGDTGRGTRSADAESPPIDRQRQVNLTRPIRTVEGSPAGVLAGQISWEWIRSSIRGLLSPDEDGAVRRHLVIVSNYDTVLIGPPDLAGQRLALPEMSRARAGIFGWSSIVWPDGKSYITGSSLAAGDGQAAGSQASPVRWVVLVREAEGAAFAPAQQLRFAILATGLALTLIVAALGWVIAGIITRPLRLIANAADRLRRGETVELPNLRGAIEVESLSASLRALVATLTFKQGKLDELESATQHDLLTGLLNRAGLQSWLSRSLAHARTEPSGLLVLVGDLDGFKQVNDTKGHAAGDTLLREVAHRLAASVRVRDAVARMGGDEFVVVLHAPLGLADRTAVDTANRLWSRVVEPYHIDGEEVVIGLSLGGAGWPEDDRQLDVVLNKADAALYAAKRAGKGRIVFHREPALR